MATKITQSTYYNVLSGSVEKRIDSTPDGTLWTAMLEGSIGATVKMYSSTDGGATWKYAPNSDLDKILRSPSLFIDVDGYAHIASIIRQNDATTITYARGTLVGGEWSWQRISGNVNSDVPEPSCEVVAFPHGTGWSAFIAHPSAFGGVSVTRVKLSYDGSVLDMTTGLLNDEGATTSANLASLDFNHIGDGKTPRADPHIYVAAANTNTNLSTSQRVTKHPYANGGWTNGTPIATSTTSLVVPRGITSVWDGDRFYICHLINASDRTDARVHWTDFNTASLTELSPPALPTAEVQEFGRGIAVAHDVVLDDLFLTVQGGWASSSGYPSDVFMSKLDRAAGTWGAWTKVADIPQVGITSTEAGLGKVSMQRHPAANLVHLLYGDYAPVTSFAGTWTIHHTTVAQLPRVPAPPTLSKPVNGATADLAAGANFTWIYSKSGPSDSQQAYVFRRNTDGVYDYWNALAQSWQSTEVWNASSTGSASMPGGAWVNGRSYNWTVRARSVYGFDSGYAPERTIAASDQPVVTITDPVGSVLTESNPLIEWIYASSDPQATYEARVFRSAPTIDVDLDTPVWSSSVFSSASARSVRVGVSLEDGLSYVTYLRVTSKTGLTSDWDDQAFSMAVAPPTGPLVRVSESLSHPEGVPNVRLNMMTRSNFAGRDQAVGVEGWEIDSDASTASTGKAWDPTQAWSPTEAWGTGESNAALTFRLTSEGGVEPGMVLTAPSAGNLAVRNVLGNDGSFPALGGNVYTGLAHVQAQTTSRNAVAKIRWFDNDEPVSQRVNLLPYASMALTTTRTDIADGWTEYVAGSRGTVTYSVASGVQTMAASALGTAATDRVGVVTDVNLLGEATYTLSLDAVVDTALPQGRRVVLWVDLIDGDGKFLTSHHAARVDTGRLTATFVTPPTTARAQAFVFIDGGDSPMGTTAAAVEARFTRPILEEASEDLGSFLGSDVSDSRYTYSWSGTADASTSLAVDILDGLISEFVGPVVATSATETRKVVASAEAPARTRRAALVVEVQALDAAEKHYVSRLSFHPDVDTSWQPGGSSKTQSLRVERSEDDGKTWRAINSFVPVDRYQRAVIYDGSFAFGSRQRYRAYTDLQLAGGAKLSSETSAPAAITVNTDSWVFRDPREPEVETLAMVIGHTRSDEARHTVQYPINARYPIVDLEGNTAAKGRLTIYVPEKQRHTMTLLLRRGVPILVQSPIGEKWLAQFTRRDYTSMVGAQRTIDVDYVEII